MQWSSEEIAELLEIDFEEIKHENFEIPYLVGPGRYQKRYETVFEFVAKRRATIQNIKGAHQPTLDPSYRPKVNSNITHAKFKYEVVGFVLAQVDGQNTVADIAKAVTQKYGVELIESQKTVERFLKKFGL
jgi:hypothetical protein